MLKNLAQTRFKLIISLLKGLINLQCCSRYLKYLKICFSLRVNHLFRILKQKVLLSLMEHKAEQHQYKWSKRVKNRTNITLKSFMMITSRIPMRAARLFISRILTKTRSNIILSKINSKGSKRWSNSSMRTMEQNKAIITKKNMMIRFKRKRKMSIWIMSSVLTL